MSKRYYYKSKNGKSFLNLKSPLNDSNYIKITKEEFEELTYVEPYKPTKQELAEIEVKDRIAFLKSELAKTDYQTLKYAEGLISEEEYAPIKAQRQAYRDEINELEEL